MDSLNISARGLIREFGKGFSDRRLRDYRKFYLLQSQNKGPVESEMKQLTKDFQGDKLEFIKNPVVAEFLGLSSNVDFTDLPSEEELRREIEWQKEIFQTQKQITNRVLFPESESGKKITTVLSVVIKRKN